MVFEFVVFAAGMVLIACAIISGLYLLCHHAGQSEENKAAQNTINVRFQHSGTVSTSEGAHEDTRNSNGLGGVEIKLRFGSKM